jgi:hypothetical protein
MATNYACDVCGSSAPIMRATAGRGTMNLCYAHEYVCWTHKLDPCPKCDGGEPDNTCEDCGDGNLTDEQYAAHAGGMCEMVNR